MRSRWCSSRARPNGLRLWCTRWRSRKLVTRPARRRTLACSLAEAGAMPVARASSPVVLDLVPDHFQRGRAGGAHKLGECAPPWVVQGRHGIRLAIDRVDENGWQSCVEHCHRAVDAEVRRHQQHPSGRPGGCAGRGAWARAVRPPTTRRVGAGRAGAPRLRWPTGPGLWSPGRARRPSRCFGDTGPPAPRGSAAGRRSTRPGRPGIRRRRRGPEAGVIGRPPGGTDRAAATRFRCVGSPRAPDPGHRRPRSG